MLTKDELQISKDITTKIYNEACKIVGYSNEDLLKFEFFLKIKKEEFVYKQEKLNNIYIKLICNLSTYDLNAIIIAWENGQQKRNLKTIDCIVLELLERELSEN